MSAGDTQPTQPLPDWQYAQPTPPRRRRAWPWIVAGSVLAVLAVAALLFSDAIARGIVERTIRDQVVTRLDLPPDQEVDVEIAGVVIPQLIAGRFDQVTLASDDVPLGTITGDFAVTARGVGFRGDVSADSATATVTLGEDELRTIMSSVEGFPVESLGLDAPNVTMSTELNLFGITFPIGVALTPGASEEGDLVLTPASLQVAGADIGAEELRRQFGILSNAVLRDWGVCIREYLPAGVTLTDTRVEGESLVAEFDLHPDIATDPALLEDGTCG